MSYIQPVRIPRASTPWKPQFSGPAFGPVTVRKVK